VSHDEEEEDDRVLVINHRQEEDVDADDEAHSDSEGREDSA